MRQQSRGRRNTLPHKTTKPLFFVAALLVSAYVLTRQRSAIKDDHVVDPLSRCGGVKLARDQKCTRLLHFQRAKEGGVGHQLSELVFGLQLASLYNASLKMKPFDDIKSKDSGDSYRFLNNMLGLNRLWVNDDYDTSNLRSTLISKPEHIPSECGVIFESRWNESYGECPGGLNGEAINCFLSPVHRLAFSKFAPCLQDVAKSGTWLKNKPIGLATNSLNVVWHVRLGDLTNQSVELHRPGDEYYENIASLMAPTFNAAVGVKHFIIGTWWMLSESHRDEYKKMFRGIIEKPIFLDISVEETFLYFMHADILIGSGSSFVSVAPLFSSTVVPVNVVPKHGWNHFAEYYLDGIDLEVNSMFVTPLPMILKLLIAKNKTDKLCWS
ncbi:uncharacterized protein MICPUCDRAFT_54854 [Micromonas pusilla CCMP1545]|uniref:Predicted protein n=1 Tax=Micromonas pusilla (strain CCMP1545) TaxID=564608 RepID=C1NAD3_MICPC|nr:uncharacterized protein MICPUCDRAFT_54854 [Micromonas pusilla CCMP1545]EEH50923.1 predicted protein [Micromonas pusilla CCMP1545]|eukprot:XP_003064943.1 predicted protein [Micromonas pusilla CCMP1545]